MNELGINAEKCNVLSYGRKRDMIHFNYVLRDVPINRVTSVRDLGVLFSTDFTFNAHIKDIVFKARSLLGFLYRCTYEFCDPYTLKYIYCAFIRSRLEYACAVWTPFYSKYDLLIESVQRRFLILALRHMNWNHAFILPPYVDRCQLIGLQTLKHRRDTVNVLTITDILEDRMDCPALKSLINTNNNPRSLILRRSRLIMVPFRRTNYGRNEPIVRMSSLLNCCTCYRPGVSRDVLKTQLLTHQCLWHRRNR